MRRGRAGGDDVLIKPANPGEPYYVARIEEIYHGDDGIMINVSWYYRPEEVKGGRKCFHGKKELLLVRVAAEPPGRALRPRCASRRRPLPAYSRTIGTAARRRPWTAARA